MEAYNTEIKQQLKNIIRQKAYQIGYVYCDIVSTDLLKDSDDQNHDTSMGTYLNSRIIDKDYKIDQPEFPKSLIICIEHDQDNPDCKNDKQMKNDTYGFRTPVKHNRKSTLFQKFLRDIGFNIVIPSITFTWDIKDSVFRTFLNNISIEKDYRTSIQIKTWLVNKELYDYKIDGPFLCPFITKEVYV